MVNRQLGEKNLRRWELQESHQNQVCSPEPGRREERELKETEALKGLKGEGLLSSGDLGRFIRSGYKPVQISGKTENSSQSFLLGKTVATD